MNGLFWQKGMANREKKPKQRMVLSSKFTVVLWFFGKQRQNTPPLSLAAYQRQELVVWCDDFDLQDGAGVIAWPLTKKLDRLVSACEDGVDLERGGAGRGTQTPTFAGEIF